jgi:hypothetical protein
VTCDDVLELIPGLITGSLAGGDADTVRAHLKDCDICRIRYEEAKELFEVWLQPTHVLPSTGFVDAVMAQVRTNEPISSCDANGQNGVSSRALQRLRRMSWYHFGLAASLTITFLYTGIFHQLSSSVAAFDTVLSTGVAKVMSYTSSLRL